MVTCAAPGCTNRSGRKSVQQRKKEQVQKITFFKFPKKSANREKWIKAISREGWLPKSSTFLCSEHFAESEVDRTSLSCTRLRENATPTIFIFPPHTKPRKPVSAD